MLKSRIHFYLPYISILESGRVIYGDSGAAKSAYRSYILIFSESTRAAYADVESPNRFTGHIFRFSDLRRAAYADVSGSRSLYSRCISIFHESMRYKYIYRCWGNPLVFTSRIFHFS